MLKNSTISVFGHTGFVGSHLVNQLASQGYNHTLILGKSRTNLLDQKETEHYFEVVKPQYVFICAAKVGGIQANIDNPYSFLYENLMIQNNVINACIKYKVKKVLYLGSSCIYPKNAPQPLKEEYLLTGELEPTNENYSIAKIAGLKLCEAANKVSKTQFVSLMPCNIVGENDSYDLKNSHVFSSLVKKIMDAKNSNQNTVELWGTGEPTREFLYVGDLAESMIWAMNKINIDTFLNVGTGIEISIAELATMIAERWNYNGKFIFNTNKPNGMMRKVLDVSKINNLGWEAKTSIHEMIDLTVKDYILK
jgi:GDP-L-fucose synthase